MRQRLLHWRGVDPDRIEGAAVALDGTALMAHGTSVTSEYSLVYRIATSDDWVTRELEVRATGADWWRSLHLRRSAAGEWSAEHGGEGVTTGPTHARLQQGGDLPDLPEALDCDLGLCPVTNTMPVMRHRLLAAARQAERPQPVELVMAWVSVPDLTVHRSSQRYTAVTPVEPGGGALIAFDTDDFSTVIEFDGDGLVVNYPGLAHLIR